MHCGETGAHWRSPSSSHSGMTPFHDGPESLKSSRSRSRLGFASGRARGAATASKSGSATPLRSGPRVRAISAIGARSAGMGRRLPIRAARGTSRSLFDLGDLAFGLPAFTAATFLERVSVGILLTALLPRWVGHRHEPSTSSSNTSSAPTSVFVVSALLVPQLRAAPRRIGAVSGCKSPRTARPCSGPVGCRAARSDPSSA